MTDDVSDKNVPDAIVWQTTLVAHQPMCDECSHGSYVLQTSRVIQGEEIIGGGMSMLRGLAILLSLLLLLVVTLVLLRTTALLGGVLHLVLP